MKWFGDRKFVTIRINGGTEFAVPCGGEVDLKFKDPDTEYEITIQEVKKKR